MQRHTDTHYDAALTRLQETLLKMGGLIEEMIARSVQALVERNSAHAEAVLQQDPEVDQLEIQVDTQCVELLALHQPMASDLRLISIALRASKDLERMGDLSVNIALNAMDLNEAAPLPVVAELPQMAEETRHMVSDALNAFVRRDVHLARVVCERDDVVDRLNDAIDEQLISLMERDATIIRRGVSLLDVTDHLERIADHATNVAEEVIFLVAGEEVRHRG